MSVDAISGNLASYKTLADGTLRITVDLPETETVHFHQLFPAIHGEVALAPLKPAELAKAEPTRTYGEYAKILKLSPFMGNFEVWRATGSDAEYLAWVREQKCVARSGEPCDGPIQAAHVWRLEDGFGKGIKGPYAAVPMCAGHHRAQHNGGENAVGGRVYLEVKRVELVNSWVWATIKRDIGIDSMKNAPPKLVLGWAQKRGIDRYLPLVYKDAA